MHNLIEKEHSHRLSAKETADAKSAAASIHTHAIEIARWDPRKIEGRLAELRRHIDDIRDASPADIEEFETLIAALRESPAGLRVLKSRHQIEAIVKDRLSAPAAKALTSLATEADTIISRARELSAELCKDGWNTDLDQAINSANAQALGWRKQAGLATKGELPGALDVLVMLRIIDDPWAVDEVEVGSPA